MSNGDGICQPKHLLLGMVIAELFNLLGFSFGAGKLDLQLAG
jgi:hypothetical protein